MTMRALALGASLLATCAMCLRCSAEEVAPGPDAASVALAELSAANAARAALAREHDAWQTERERMKAVQDAEAAERVRLQRELALAQAQPRPGARRGGRSGGRRRGRSGPGPHRRGRAHPRAPASPRLRAQLPPGAIATMAVPEGAGVDEVIRAIDESERDAATASIELVAGSLDGAETAVKLLRVSGCAAWWSSLDARAGGTIAIDHGALVLQRASVDRERQAIVDAIAMLEGRKPAEFALLPPSPRGARQTIRAARRGRGAPMTTTRDAATRRMRLYGAWPHGAWLRATLMCALLLGASWLAGAETADPVAVEAQRRHQQADLDLAAERARILTEREASAQAIARSEEALSDLRDQLAATLNERDASAAQARKAREAQDRQRLEATQAVDRILVAARLPLGHGDATATQLQRLDAGLRGLDQRVEALAAAEAASLGPERIVARSGAEVEAPVLRLGQARAVALGDSGDTRGVLARAQDGRIWVVSGAALPASARAAPSLALIPLDADNTLASQQSAGRTFSAWLRAGRFFIWPIGVVLVLGCAIALDRALALARARIDPGLLERVLALVRSSQLDQAKQAVARLRSPLERVLALGLDAVGFDRSAREAALERAMLAEAPRLQRGLGLLMVLASIAPLLGLLGTVTGMIDMFSVIAAHGSGNAKSLSGSISEALVTTQAGMIVAVPLLVVHAILARSVEKRLMLLEEGGAAVLTLEGAPASGSSESED